MHLESERCRRQQGSALDQRFAPLARRETRDEESEVAQLYGAEVARRLQSVGAERPLRFDRSAPEVGHAQLLERRLRPALFDFQRQRTAVDLAFAHVRRRAATSRASATERSRSPK